MAKTIKFIPYEWIFALNDSAIENDFNRALTDECVMNLPYGANFPITFEMVHNDTEMRVVFAWKDDAGLHNAQLDMTFEDYDSLPVHEMEA